MRPTSRPSRLSPYTGVAAKAFQRFTTYRGATFAGVITNTIFGFVYVAVFAAVHDAVGDIDGFTVVDTTIYVFASQAFLAMTGAFGDREISNRIRSGDIAADLWRPVDFQLWWLAHDLGKAAFLLLFRGIPPFVIGVLILDLPLPQDPLVWVGFVITTSFGVVLAFSIRFLANLSGFWLLDARGLVALVTFAQVLLAGHVVPLHFMPDGLEAVVRSLPFAGIMSLPVETLLGMHRGWGLASVLVFQTAWMGVLLMAGRMMLASAHRHLVVQGG